VVRLWGLGHNYGSSLGAIIYGSLSAPDAFAEPFSGIFSYGLRIWRDSPNRPGAMQFTANGGKAADFNSGLQYGVNHGWLNAHNYGSPSHPSQIIMCEQTAGAVVLSRNESPLELVLHMELPAVAALLPSGALRWCGIRFSSTDYVSLRSQREL
jgi:hypothetical protein